MWVSSAAGGKGDWRVIKKQKGDNQAPAAKSPKEDAKPAEGGAPKKSKLQDKVEGMSPEELEALQKMVAGAMAKKKPAAKTEEKPAKVEEPEDDEGYAVDPPEGFEHYDKYSARKNYAGLECEELWTNEDEDNEIIVARMTDAQKKETWPDDDHSGTGKFVVMYDGDIIDFYDHKDDAFDEAEKLADEDEEDD